MSKILIGLALALAGGGLYWLGRQQAAAGGGATDWSRADRQTPAPPGAGTFTGTTNPVHVPGGFI